MAYHIELLVSKGTPHITPLIDYLFLNNADFTKKDALKAFRQIYQLYDAKQMDASWLKFNERKLWQPIPNLPTHQLTANSFIDNTVVLQKNEHLFYALSTNLEQEAALVEKELKSRGLLDANDRIKAPNNTHFTDLSFVSFEIDRVRWNKQRFKQRLFFVVKLLVLTASLFILFHLLKTLSLRYQNYRAYLDLRENFLNMVNHELKTPLASVRIMVEALAKRGRQNMDMKDYPERIVSQLDKLWLMVDNLLSLNHIKSGEYTADYQTVDIHELIDSLSARVIESCQQPIIIKNALAQNTTLLADPMLLELLLNNLITNAIKYCDKEQIEIRFTDGDKHDQFLFYDNGRGIDVLEQEKVFDEFYRSEQQQKGTGVGLALCKHIMRLHKGDITIVSSNQQGTVWCLTFCPNDYIGTKQ